jgi:hypothetical protein
MLRPSIKSSRAVAETETPAVLDMMGNEFFRQFARLSCIMADDPNDPKQLRVLKKLVAHLSKESIPTNDDPHTGLALCC